MNSAVRWLMFKGIQHLLDGDQPPAAVCLNVNSEPMYEGCFFLFLFMFPNLESQNELAQSQRLQRHESKTFTLSISNI